MDRATLAAYDAGPTDRRDERGRLYSAFNRNLVVRELSGAVVVLDQEPLFPS